AASKTHSHITEAVVDSAVEPDVRAPVARVKRVDPAYEAPISRCPEQAHARRLRPGAGHPVVTSPAPGPVPRRPHVALFGTRRLVIVRQRRRRFIGLNLSI